MTATHDLAALLAALNAGDDSALGPLADLLEERGDPRAAGLRLIDEGPFPGSGCWIWAEMAHAVFLRHRRAYARLSSPRGSGGPKTYPSRSAAYLALGEALPQG